MKMQIIFKKNLNKDIKRYSKSYNINNYVKFKLNWKFCKIYLHAVIYIKIIKEKKIIKMAMITFWQRFILFILSICQVLTFFFKFF